MATLKETFKGGLISTNNKYNASSEKMARIININEKDNSYTISIISNDGLYTTYDDICVRYNGADNDIKKEPSVGEYVYVKEDNGRYVITGIYKEHQSKTVSSDVFSNTYNGTIGGFGF